MFKVRRVVLLMIAALVTGFVEYVGLHRLGLLWSGPAGETTPRLTHLAPLRFRCQRPRRSSAGRPSRDGRIGVLTVQHDAAELFVDGRRLWLPVVPVAAPQGPHAPDAHRLASWPQAAT